MSRPSAIDRVQKHIETLESKIETLSEDNKALREKIRELKAAKPSKSQTRLPRIPKPAAPVTTPGGTA